ncbi:hypothetical protein NA63_2256 [Flavobacteriaceae bacterium MAR_2010_105]|nr:hypothetical protein NA63_2256 [Flavobacteriaceae bacterium MAR_2010_105]
MNQSEDDIMIKACLNIIEQKLGWGDSSQWHHDVFVELSDLIQKDTKTLLSTTTLKRVWGKIQYPHAPSISTLNTLSQFAGYANWREFTNKANVKKPSWFERKVHPNLGIIIPSAAILAVIFISLFSMVGIKTKVTPIDLSKIEFRCHPVTDDLPNSVVFDFDLNHTASDSIYIQQFWDPSKTIKIKSEQQQATGIYYYPGYFRAKLVIDGVIIKERDLFIKSQGWVATVDYEPIPKYIKQIKTLQLPLNTINEIRSSERPITSTYHYIDDFKALSGDDFRLQTTIKNVYNDTWAVCQNATIIIVGTKSAHMIPFAISGCASNLGMMMSDVYLSGKEHDLSALSVNLSKLTKLKIEVINKRISVFADNKKLFSSTYNASIGNIVGLRYRFLGAGEVEQIRLTNLSESETLIDEHF